jgi:hypothetical protein
MAGRVRYSPGLLICRLSGRLMNPFPLRSRSDTWCPNGREFVFVSNRRKDDKPALYRKTVGGGDEELLFISSDAHTCVHQWLNDDSILFYWSR